MKLASWNVNGLRAIMRKGDLVSFLAGQRPDLLCLQEIKLKPEQVDFEIDGYQLILNSAERAGYSGTGLLIKNELIDTLNKPVISRNFGEDIEVEFNLANDQFGNPNNEGRVISIELPDFYVVSVYTPNSKGDLSRLKLRYEQWDPAFLKYVNDLRQVKPVIFAGDLNVAHREIDLANPKQNVGKHGFTDEEREGLGNYLTAGFVDSFRKIHGDEPNQYTWWSHWAKARERNIGWRIDYYMVDNRLVDKIKNATIYADYMGSDHCPIGVDIG